VPVMTTHLRARATRSARCHRLTEFGVVLTDAAYGSSRQGFDAEWREICLLTVDGDGISRCEKWDGTELDAALARFDENSGATPTEPSIYTTTSSNERRSWPGSMTVMS